MLEAQCSESAEHSDDGREQEGREVGPQFLRVAAEQQRRGAWYGRGWIGRAHHPML